MKLFDKFIDKFGIWILLAAILYTLYRIQKFGLRGYLDQRLEMKKRSYDAIYSAAKQAGI